MVMKKKTAAQKKATPRPRIDLNQTTSVTGNEHKPAQRKRIPVDTPHNPLEYPERPGYHRHVFNDKPGRLERALRGGYQFVTKDQIPDFDVSPLLSQKEEVDSRVSWAVGQEDDGRAIRGYLMEIPEELYQADQRAREGKTIDVLKETLRQDQSDKSPGRDELYPTGPGIKFGRDA
jgi:hypothetical protein